MAERKEEDEDEDPDTRRQKKKSYYAKLKRMEEERQKELADKYRDRHLWRYRSVCSSSWEVKTRTREREEKKRSYFEKPSEEEDFRDKPTESAKELVKTINDRFKSYADMEDEKQKASEKAEKDRLKKLQSKMEIDSYAECYPGAAFQYGVKMADGRRTRWTVPKDVKAKLDRGLQQINRIIQERKVAEPGEGEKRTKY